MYVCACINLCVLHVFMCPKSPEDMNSPGAGDISHCELSDVSAGNQNMVPLQNSKSYEPLNHLSSVPCTQHANNTATYKS